MQTFEDFGRWVGKMGGQEGLALAYEKELGKKVSQSAISGWFKSRRIPEPRRPDLKTLGWRGPWEWPEESKVESAPASGSFVTERAFSEEHGYWKGKYETLESKIDQMKKVLDELMAGYKAHIQLEPDKAHPQELPR